MNHDHDNLFAAWFKVFSVWLVYGVSQMSPLQWVQFIAGIAATVYSAVQTYLLIRDRILRKKEKKE